MFSSTPHFSQEPCGLLGVQMEVCLPSLVLLDLSGSNRTLDGHSSSFSLAALTFQGSRLLSLFKFSLVGLGPLVCWPVWFLSVCLQNINVFVKI